MLLIIPSATGHSGCCHSASVSLWCSQSTPSDILPQLCTIRSLKPPSQGCNEGNNSGNLLAELRSPSLARTDIPGSETTGRKSMLLICSINFKRTRRGLADTLSSSLAPTLRKIDGAPGFNLSDGVENKIIPGTNRPGRYSGVLKVSWPDSLSLHVVYGGQDPLAFLLLLILTQSCRGSLALASSWLSLAIPSSAVKMRFVSLTFVAASAIRNGSRT
jgi:hypothetical protein